MAPIKTALNREYATRFFCVAALFVAIAGWFFYDGKWGYPNENARVEPVAKALAAKNFTAKEWMSTEKYGRPQIDDYFAQHNVEAPAFYKDIFQSAIREEKPEIDKRDWAKAVLSLPVHSPEKIHEQFVSAAVALFAAFIFCMVPLYRGRKTFLCDDEALHLLINQEEKAIYRLADIAYVDRSQWEKRGILKVVMKNQTAFVLDAWHYTGVAAIEKILPAADVPPAPAQDC